MAYEIVQELCTGCGRCPPVCPVGAISEGTLYFSIDPTLCCDCVGYYRQANCIVHCPVIGAIRRIES